MIIFYDPETLKLTHVVVHAPDDYKAQIAENPSLHWLETDEDIPPEEIVITPDKKIVRQVRVLNPDETTQNLDLDGYREWATRVIDEKSHLDMEPYLIAQKYLWATATPVEKAIELEAEMLNMPLADLISHIKHRNDEERVRLQWAELNRQRAKLALAVATSKQNIDVILDNFDPAAPVDGIFVVDTSNVM